MGSSIRAVQESLNPKAACRMGCAWISDEEAKEEPNPSQPRSPPYNSPFNHAEEFGITEKTAKFMGLDEQAYAERIVPSLRLDLEEATGEGTGE